MLRGRRYRAASSSSRSEALRWTVVNLFRAGLTQAGSPFPESPQFVSHEDDNYYIKQGDTERRVVYPRISESPAACEDLSVGDRRSHTSQMGELKSGCLHLVGGGRSTEEACPESDHALGASPFDEVERYVKEAMEAAAMAEREQGFDDDESEVLVLDEEGLDEDEDLGVQRHGGWTAEGLAEALCSGKGDNDTLAAEEKTLGWVLSLRASSLVDDIVWKLTAGEEAVEEQAQLMKSYGWSQYNVVMFVVEDGKASLYQTVTNPESSRWRYLLVSEDGDLHWWMLYSDASFRDTFLHDDLHKPTGVVAALKRTFNIDVRNYKKPLPQRDRLRYLAIKNSFLRKTKSNHKQHLY